jgi:hypothetical protein
MAHLLQERYSDLVLAKLRASLVTRENVIFNTSYEGDPKAGAVKIPTRDAEVVVSDYDKANGLKGTTGSTSYTTLTITQDKALNEVIDGYDASAVPDSLVADRLDSAGYALGSVVDKYSVGILESQGTVLPTVTALTKSTVYEQFVDIATALSEANVPQDGRYAIVSPAVYGLLLKDTTNFIRQGDLSQKLVETGAVGSIAGITIYNSNNLMKANTTVKDGKTVTTEIIAGHPTFATRVEEFSVPVHIQDLNGSGNYIGASAVQGRLVFDAKVLRPSAIIIKRVEQ